MNARVFSSLEPLEARIAPAGVVNVISAGGTVKILGDAQANSVKIEIVGPGQLLVTGQNSTTIAFNGNTSTSATVTNYAKDLSVALGAGIDTIDVINGGYYGNVTLDGGADSTSITFSGTSALIVPGSLKLLAKAGDDEVLINTGGKDFQVGRDFSIMLGEGGVTSSTTTTQRMLVGGKFMVKGGTGVEDIFWTPTSDFVVGGDVNIDTGKGLDRIAISAGGDTAINGKLTLKGGNSTPPPVMAIVSASLGITAGDEFTVRGAVTATSVDGIATITLGGTNTSSYAGGVTIKTGKGQNNVTLNGANQTYVGKVSVTAGGATQFNFTPTTFFIGGDFSFKGSKVTDAFNFTGDGIITGKVSVDLGDGFAQSLLFKGNTGLAVFGDIALKQGAKTGTSSTTVARIAASKSFAITTAGADDTLTLDNLAVTGAMNLSAGAGSDTLLFETTGLTGPSAFVGFFKVLMGDGADNVTMGVTGDANNRLILDLNNLVAPPKFEGLLDQGAGQDAFSGFNNRGNIGNLQLLNQEI